MDPIPIWVRRPWDAWDLRILVLLSFVLQAILAIFGSRRKYISSLWMSVLVWSAYLMADLVATVALGKLSDAEANHGNGNELWAIWAPLLLLHLGGPDTITAYSLEDNKLWMRHLMGLVVQMFVVIYVILMSWKNSWFLFMSVPAFVAGVAKYGERTWVLKSVSDNKYEDNEPVGDLSDIELTWSHEYVNVLVIAHAHLKVFTGYLDNQSRLFFKLNFPDKESAPNIVWDAVEVEMGLTYRKGGCILRFISFVCTVAVLVGLIVQIAYFNLRKEDDEIDIVITLVLLGGALALEFYAAIVMFSSNWMMLWLIKSRRQDLVIWLSDRFPCLFNKGKNWSNTMGQFDLLDYWLKLSNKETEVERPSRKKSCSITKCRERIMLVLGRKFVQKKIRFVLGSNFEKIKRHLHKTVRPSVYNGILDLLGRDNTSSISDDRDIDDEVREILTTVDASNWSGGGFKIKIMCMHLATKICYQKEKEPVDDAGSSRSDSSWKENMEVSKALSNYMMYLFAMKPSLLPENGKTDVDQYINELYYISGRDAHEACRHLMKEHEGSPWYKAATRLLKIDDKSKRWEIMKLIWVRMLLHAASEEEGFRVKDGHLQQLRQGGELLTFVWLYFTPRRTVDLNEVCSAIILDPYASLYG